MSRAFSRLPALLGLLCLLAAPLAQAAPPVPLFTRVGPSAEPVPAHVRGSRAVQVNRRALESPTIEIDLFGTRYVAERQRIERLKPGQLVWVGHLQGQPFDTVVITLRGTTYSGMFQRGGSMYRLSGGRSGNRLLEVDLASLPPDDGAPLPDGGGAVPAGTSTVVPAATNVQQDLLVVYNQSACTAAGSCAQLDADIATAVADMNAAYAASNIAITANLVGTALTQYTGTTLSPALSALRNPTDGVMDEVHGLRDQLGADIVALVYTGEGCGIGYLPASPTFAFSVTAFNCLVGNRTMAHEIGHNQGAHHDRVTASAGSSTAYNYGYRRCDDNTAEDVGAPYFRTILAYSCAGSPRVGRYSNPQVNYLDVPQGIDVGQSAGAAFNARTINESANYVAGFRTSAVTTRPAAPTGLSAVKAGFDRIALGWTDASTTESSFNVQSSLDQANWTTIAQLGANETTYEATGLQPQTTHYFRVNAQNSAGASAWTAVASATTDPLPASIEEHATKDLPGLGTVSGTYLATHVADGTLQRITEVATGGSRRARQQGLRHAWDFEVFGGQGGVVFRARAWVSGAEGVQFFYSRDAGASWTPMFTVTATTSGNEQSFLLPAGTSGALRVEARDVSAVGGEAADTLSVDRLVVVSNTQLGSPPTAPSQMTATAASSSSVQLSFQDNAADELGFEVRRAGADPAGNCAAGVLLTTLGASAGTGQVGYTDPTAAPSTTFWYWARSFNAAGDNGQCSNAASATTPAAPIVSATAVGRKDKGFQVTDLTWSGARTANVEVRRNGAVVATRPSGTGGSGSYSDAIGIKGTATYVYEVCETGANAACSAPMTVVF